MRIKTKICGITNLEDALFCAHAGADYLGFIFYNKSPRFIEPVNAASIIQHLPFSVTPVGVFVNEQRERITSIIDKTRIRLIQLSGDEQPEDCQRYPLKVWKAFRFTTFGELEQAKQYSLNAALLDGSNGTLYGGTGTLADAAIAKKMKEYHPIILAGGLTPENIVDIIHQVQPTGIDVNSGVESSPGKKDHAKVTLLFEQLNNLRNTN